MWWVLLPGLPGGGEICRKKRKRFFNPGRRVSLCHLSFIAEALKVDGRDELDTEPRMLVRRLINLRILFQLNGQIQRLECGGPPELLPQRKRERETILGSLSR